MRVCSAGRPEHQATQRQDKLTNGREAIEAQLAELRYRRSMLETERAITVDLTNVRARARDIATSINPEGTQHHAFTKASHNVVAAVVFLYTLLTPSVDGVDKVYRQLKDILGIVAA
jgi:hypothetical protein